MHSGFLFLRWIQESKRALGTARSDVRSEDRERRGRGNEIIMSP